MSILANIFVSTGLFFLFIFLSGVRLNRMGRPYSIPLVTIHKLIGLAAGIYLGISVYRLHQIAPLDAVQVAAIVVTVLLFAINVATGSLLSTNKTMPVVVSSLNKLAPYLTVLSTAVMVVLLT